MKKTLKKTCHVVCSKSCSANNKHRYREKTLLINIIYSIIFYQINYIKYIIERTTAVLHDSVRSVSFSIENNWMTRFRMLNVPQNIIIEIKT